MASLQRITIAPFRLLFQPLYRVSSPLYGHSFVLQSKHFLCSLISDAQHITHSLTLKCTPYVPRTNPPVPNNAVNATACLYGVVSSQESVRISEFVCEIWDYHAVVMKLLSCLKPGWFQNISICVWDLRFWRLEYENCRHLRYLGISRCQYHFVRF